MIKPEKVISRVLSMETSMGQPFIWDRSYLPASCDPTRELRTGSPFSPRREKRSPIWSCSRWGLPCHPGHPECGELLPRHFTLTGKNRRYLFCGTFLGSPPLGVTQHPTLWSSDFPLELILPAAACPSQAQIHGYRWRDSQGCQPPCSALSLYV